MNKKENRIKEFRVAKGMTQDEVAARFEPRKTVYLISRWERGATIPRADALIQLSRILGVHAEDLYA